MDSHVRKGLGAGVAAVLLLGGAGSLAYWNSTDVAEGATISSGRLAIDAGACDTAGWTVSNAVEGITDAPFDLGSERVVPGDVLRKACTIDVTAVGSNLRATLALAGLSPAGTTMGFDDFEVDGAITRGGSPIAFDQPVVLNDGDRLMAEITVSVPLKADVVDNDSMDTSIVLGDLTFTATQATS